MRVKLFFETLKDPELEEKVKGIEIITLKTSVQFKTADGWTEPFDALGDKGAPIRLIPCFIWKKIDHTELTDYQAGGITAGTIPVKAGTVNCTLIDWEGNATKEREIYAYLALTDKVPLIIGFKDLLSKCATYFDYQNKEAYIEEDLSEKPQEDL